MADSQERSEQARERQAPSAETVFEAIRHEGEEELRRRAGQLFWSALAAGLAMGFSFLAEGLLAEALPDTRWAHAVVPFGYVVGFFIVVLGRQQLYTENPLTAVLPLLNRPRLHYLIKVLRLWAIVLAANILGAFLFAWVLSETQVVDPVSREPLRELSLMKFKTDFATTLLRAVFAGWLIALMVWLLPFAETARWVVVVLLTYVVGLAGFPHVIAGAVHAFYAVLVGSADWGQFFIGFFLPALLGNTIGGLVLVALLNYGQVASPGDDGA